MGNSHGDQELPEASAPIFESDIGRGELSVSAKLFELLSRGHRATWAVKRELVGNSSDFTLSSVGGLRL